jgi:hypothetical protein
VPDEDKHEVNDGMEGGTLEHWTLMGPTGREGTVVDRNRSGAISEAGLNLYHHPSADLREEPNRPPKDQVAYDTRCSAKVRVSLRRSGTTLLLGYRGWVYRTALHDEVS